MDIILISLTILASLAIGWSIGANDAANSLGTAVGSRVVTLKQAILLIAIFGFLGAFLQGGHVSTTIGKGIVPIDQLDKDVGLYLALIASFAACAWVVIATYWKIPISTSHSIVGAVAGAGLALGTTINWKVLFDIFTCWIATPFGAAILGYIFYRSLQNVFYRIVPRRYLRVTFATLIVASGCYVAYTWGANDVANSIGLVVGSGILLPNIAIILGGIAIVVGITTWGYKVIETVGSEITHLLPIMAFSAQLASAINVHIYTMFGIPVSTSHSIVGAIFGVGLVKGMHVLNGRIARDMALCWIATPFVSGLISFSVFKLIMIFVKIM
ncbi:MAG: inorganic phosphate transporter family protein [Candidatus Omnitrophica bacterium]|nr:inorganic phosphate transporter family protein [Candidatus Omnitrophota bacterium]MBU4488410.1 inorganic phosphate transporter family protein [Candidatus Omnitrophota bacterium]MCG2704926.1 inorganic phosphate transporter family protein [Candidatus Omnitrophota bacterium]